MKINKIVTNDEVLHAAIQFGLHRITYDMRNNILKDGWRCHMQLRDDYKCDSETRYLLDATSDYGNLPRCETNDNLTEILVPYNVLMIGKNKKSLAIQDGEVRVAFSCEADESWRAFFALQLLKKLQEVVFDVYKARIQYDLSKINDQTVMLYMVDMRLNKTFV